MGKKERLIWLIAPIMLFSSLGQAKQSAGWVEKVSIHPGKIILKAKLDTGAKFTSLSCDCSQPFIKNGQKWIRFSITGMRGYTASFERRIVRHVKIKQHFGEKQRRVVVKLGICLANIYKEAEVTLVDRSGFNYLMLLGRDFMAGSVFVDPASTFITKPRCKRVRKYKRGSLN